MTEQTERAFQKQPTVFLNDKFRTQGIGKKPKNKDRYWKNVGLGFKTPREVSQLFLVEKIGNFLKAIEGNYIDKKCPFTGNVSIRGRILTGVVIKNKMQRTIVIRRDYLHFVPKYRRYEKRHKNMSVHCSPCFRFAYFDTSCYLPFNF